MAVQLNHTIVHSHDAAASSAWAADLLGLPKPTPFGPFMVLAVSNGVSLDYMDHSGDITPQHYAFLITEDEFDEIFGRIQEQGVDYWADPMGRQPGEINRHDGGRGVYFADPDGHWLEIITRPYGSGG